MFTGIIEQLGRVDRVEVEGSNVHYWVESEFSSELKIDQSVAHNGVCLTVVERSDGAHKVTAIDETLKRTNLRALQVGSKINLERCLPANGRFDGHVVQGHVDQRASVQSIEEVDGSWNCHFRFEQPDHALVVQKGSIAVNGVSLTVVDANEAGFSVSIIPYTYEHTTFHELQIGDLVNIEFDILGKYVLAATKRLQP